MSGKTEATKASLGNRVKRFFCCLAKKETLSRASPMASLYSLFTMSGKKGGKKAQAGSGKKAQAGSVKKAQTASNYSQRRKYAPGLEDRWEAERRDAKPQVSTKVSTKTATYDITVIPDIGDTDDGSESDGEAYEKAKQDGQIYLVPLKK